MIESVIAEMAKPWDPKMVKDPVQEHLLDIISKKKKGRHPSRKPKEASERPSNVVSIMDALKKSIGAEEKRGKGR
jgi:DNA end-binding protein Ku